MSSGSARLRRRPSITVRATRRTLTMSRLTPNSISRSATAVVEPRYPQCKSKGRCSHRPFHVRAITRRGRTITRSSLKFRSLLDLVASGTHE